MQAKCIRAQMEKRVSEILFYVWDPIGVNAMPSCRDEYADYVPLVSTYLLLGSTEATIDALLLNLMQEYIGVGLTKAPRRKHQHLETIRMLMEWKQDFFNQHPLAQSAAPNFSRDESILNQIAWSRRYSGSCRSLETSEVPSSTSTEA